MKIYRRKWEIKFVKKKKKKKLETGKGNTRQGPQVRITKWETT